MRGAGNIDEARDIRGALLTLIRHYLRHYVGRIVAVLLLSLISTAAVVAAPFLLGQGTNVVVDGIRSGGVDFPELAQVLSLAAGCYILSALLRFWFGYIIRLIIQDLGYEMRRDCQQKIDRMPLSVLDKQQRGDVLSRVTNDVDNVTQSLLQTLSEVLSAIYQIIGIVAVMVYLSWSVALASLVVIPVGIIGILLLLRRSRPYFRDQWRLTGDVSAVVEESFTGLDVVAVYGLEDEFQGQFDAANGELYDASFRAQAIAQMSQPLMMLVQNGSFAIVTLLGSIQAMAGTMTIGGLQAMMQYTRQLSHPLQSLASTANLIQSAAASAERIFDYLAQEEMAPDAKSSYREVVAPEARRGTIEFSHVRFAYEPETPVIRDLSLRVEPGHSVAIVGPTGAGKTTLVNLLMRFYEVDSGAITVDGAPIDSFTKESLREHFGMVLQDTWLFDGTVWENIAFGKDGATRDDAIAAAAALGIDDLLETLPHGFDTHIGDEGENVSAGEKQLITIARAYLANPDVLILDEATSSVDTRTEALIQDAMERLREGRTSFIIAHRLSTVRNATTILVMEAGDVVESGTHEELLAAGGAYARLYESQWA
ncbi:ABC transporter ATP-binding protein [Actinotignum sp. GS-2025b]|uniref:ABC transporter ATP-binding protein n=1 Tax=Actinotignum sp. GS-2025b TaxID=3427275 RepID=UPI003F47996E